MNTKLLLNIGKYALAVALLGWVIWSNWEPKAATPPEGSQEAQAKPAPGLKYVWQRHVVEREPIHFGFLVLGFSVYVAAAALTMFRWYLLVRALDLQITIRDAYRYGMIGVFFNTFLPGAVGGDIIKAAVLARGQSRRTAAVATVIMDRLLALWALVWFVAILGSVFWLAGMLEGTAATASASIVTGALITVGVTSALWLGMGLLPDSQAEVFAGMLGKLPLVGHMASDFWRSAWMYRRRQAAVALVLVLSWVGQVGFVIVFYCAARVLYCDEMGAVPSLTQHFLLVPIGLVMQALIPTPGGAGGGEWGFAALYHLFGAEKANGALASLVQRVFAWTLGVAGYAVYLWVKPAGVTAPAGAIQTQQERTPLPAAG